MRIETHRCIIRPFEEKHLDAFTAYRNDAEWMRYQGFKGLSRDEYRIALLGKLSLESGMQLALTSKADGCLLGDIYLRSEGETLWLGYTIAPDHARRGYICEAIGGVAEWAAGKGFACVKAGVLPDNTASSQLLEKCGFAFQGLEEGEFVYYLLVNKCENELK